jgi:predicted MFS family arabinose efflux permease
MVLAAPSMLPSVPPEHRGLASGAIFAGVGLGIALSGTLVPLLLRAGLATTWLALGLTASGLTLAAWRIWPDRMLGTGAAPRHAPRSTPLLALYAVYALCAVGLVPHMVFLVDYVARGLGRGLGEGALLWVVFGCAACAGPLVTGWLADRLGIATTLRLGLVVTAACVALPALSDALPALVVSSLVTGAFVPGVVPLALGRVQALTPPEVSARAAVWGIATACFALGQAAAAYALSFLFAQGGGYEALFALGGGALLLAAAIDLAAARSKGA